MANRPNPKKRNISSSDDESGPSVPNKTNNIVKTESTESVSQDTVEIINEAEINRLILNETGEEPVGGFIN